MTTSIDPRLLTRARDFPDPRSDCPADAPAHARVQLLARADQHVASPKRCSATGRPSPRQMRARSEKRSGSLDLLRRKDRQISLTGRFARLRPASGPHGPWHAATLPLIEPLYSLVKDLGSDRSESLRQTRMWVLDIRQKPHSSSEAVRPFSSLPACGRRFRHFVRWVGHRSTRHTPVKQHRRFSVARDLPLERAGGLAVLWSSGIP